MSNRPYPPVNFIGSDNWQPYTRLIPANEVHEWVNRQILIDTGSIYNPDHGHLLDADLCFMWASDSFAKKGRYVLGQAEQIMLRASRRMCLLKGPEIYSRPLAICLMTMLIVSCAQSLPAPVVVDTACNWVRIIYLTDHDIDVLDKQTKRDILAHNKSVLANCQSINLSQRVK